MLNHSTWRLNDSTFTLNRRRTCQDRGEAGMLKPEHVRIGRMNARIAFRASGRGRSFMLPHGAAPSRDRIAPEMKRRHNVRHWTSFPLTAFPAQGAGVTIFQAIRM